jgi:alpha-mannosidase
MVRKNNNFYCFSIKTKQLTFLSLILRPFDETKRKVARSWSSQVGLMDIYPEFKFVCSQAQQFEWLKDNYPKLFDKVKEKVSKDQFLPIGGVCII